MIRRPVGLMYYAYILYSLKDKKFYSGFTADLKRRFTEHQAGMVISTRLRRPLQLVMYEAYHEKDDAKAREKFFKTTKGKIHLRKQLKTFLSNNQPK
jgi:putative endonuclease